MTSTMKRSIFTLFAIAPIAFAICAWAQDAHQWEALLNIVDDNGGPVAGADVSVFYDVPPALQGKDPGRINGLTDSNGVFTASNDDNTYSLRFLVQKSGYYADDLFNDFHGVFSSENLNPHLTLALKKVVNPIPMYAKLLNTHVPALDKPVGFDLMAGDWVGPYGSGTHNDMLITGHFDKHADGESDFTLTVGFPNPGDGIQEFTVPDSERGSALRSPHEAPAEGYQPQWVQTDNRKPGKRIETNRDSNRNYFFRVRTVLDESGNVKSALYGKIYGDFMEFTYYLDPTPNDRNVEFDPGHNLLGGLRSFEQVKSP